MCSSQICGPGFRGQGAVGKKYMHEKNICAKYVVKK